MLHSPYVNIKYFNQTISDIFSKIKSDPNFKNVNEVIVVGDMNINLLNHANHIPGPYSSSITFVHALYSFLYASSVPQEFTY